MLSLARPLWTLSGQGFLRDSSLPGFRAGVVFFQAASLYHEPAQPQTRRKTKQKQTPHKN